MLSDVVQTLVCPVCGEGLQPGEGALRCANGHSFDVARQGYVNLLQGPAPAAADTAQMVQDRAAFLEAGHYAPLSARIAALAAQRVREGLILDAGAGTGHYLSKVLEAIPAATGIAMDISKFALRRAARGHARMGAVVGDVWKPLPLRSGAAALVLNVFAPRSGAEFRRVLRDDGTLLVVTPTQAHLSELVQALGLLSVDSRKAERLEEALASWFRVESQECCEFVMRLSHSEALSLAHMGPSGHHRGVEALREKLEQLAEPLAVSASFNIAVYRPV